MRKRKGVIREGVALALSLALVGSGMNLSGISVMAADMGQDDAFNPAVTSEGVAGWNNSDDDKETITEFGKDPITSTGNNTIASDNDSDKAPWNQIDESEDENVVDDVADVEQADSETVETSEGANAGIALLSVVEDVLEADSPEQRIAKEIIDKIKAGVETSIDVDLTGIDIKSLDWDKIFYTVVRDCPYDAYWMTGHMQSDGQKITFDIAEQYKDKNDPTKVDQDQIIQVTNSKNTAKQIINESKDKDAKDLLKAYQERICDLTSYNETERDKYIKNPNDPTIDVNAYQPFYVFDNDAKTSVVCEGYSKAFQYLCDESELPSNTKCYTVSGNMSGGTGSGAHMWNIVRIDGKSYLVDVTNSDTRTVGDPADNGGTTPLFLAVPTSGSVAEGYTFRLPNGQTITYKYDDETLNLYGKDNPILKLANTPSESKPDGTPKPTPTPTPNPNPIPDWDFEGKPDWDQDSSNSDVNPDWIDQDSTTNPDLDMDPNWTDDNPIPGGSVSSDKNNSGSSATNNTNNNGVINGNVNMDVNNGNSTGNTNTSTNAAGSNAQPSTASPKTGDHNTIMIYMMLMLLALGTIGSVCVIRQKRN
ncbi:MAG: hypothetical protein HFG28_14165 [Eubacterium sp.]|nr:hypothetical protein [Eubacterium sp.]NBJ04024.1 hypothetical protein [Lachnospiraceae bacterium]